MTTAVTVLFVWAKIKMVLYWIIGIAGLAGVIFAATTRDDAFEVADAQPKYVWVALLAGSTVCLALNLPLLAWIGMVIIGVYFFDLRPRIKDILEGNSGW